MGKWFKHNGNWLEEMRGNLSLVATVIATITFQVTMNPPGGRGEREREPMREEIKREGEREGELTRRKQKMLMGTTGGKVAEVGAFI